MSAHRAYLDHNATSPLRDAARAAVADALACVGNPSSVHGEGRDAKRRIEAARSQVAGLVGADPDRVIFTSGATEAVHLGLTPDISLDGRPRPASALYVGETEHPCVLTGGRFDPERIAAIPADEQGIVDLAALDALLDAHDGDEGSPFVAVQLVNSETGVIQPVAEIARRVRLKGGYTLCDAVQAVGRLTVDIEQLGVDMLALSSHKIGGPQGAGALVLARSSLSLAPAIRGGGQEMNRRAGTENVAAIAGFGAAAAEVADFENEMRRIGELRDSLETRLVTICEGNGLGDRLAIFSAGAERVANTTLFAVEGMDAQTALIAFDLDGVAVSSGSACSSGKVGNSHVLAAMEVAPDLARAALRASLGWTTTQEDIERFAKSAARQLAKLAQRLGVATQELEAAG